MSYNGLLAAISSAIWITALGAALGSPSLAADKSFFQSSSSGFTVKWTAKDLSASPQATPATLLFSAKKTAGKERPKKSDKTTVDRSFKLLSLVGPVLSYQDESSLDWPGMAHPGVGDVRFYHALDLRRPTKKLLLTDLFAPTDIYEALMANALVKQSLHQLKAKPKTLPELMNKIQDADVEPTSADGNGAKLLFNRDMLSQFCFNKVTPKGVDVTISLYDQANNEISPMHLSLPLKDGDLKKWLTDGDSKKAGILADKLASITKDDETDFHFDP